jgi:penicillin-binding protein 1A
MTDSDTDFDFDFQVNDQGDGKGRPVDDRENGDGDSNGHAANGSGAGELVRGDRENGSFEPPEPAQPPRAPAEPPAGNGGDPDEDWLSLADDDLADSDLDSLAEHDEGPAGPPTPGEGRSLAREARRRATQRPGPERGEDDDGDFESLLESQPQKSGMARRSSAISGGFRDLLDGGRDRLKGSRKKLQSGREKLQSGKTRLGDMNLQIPGPGAAAQPQVDGNGAKPPQLPRRISARRPRKPQPGRIKKLRLAIIVVGLGALALVSMVFGMMMALAQDLPDLSAKEQYAASKNTQVFDDRGRELGTLLSNNQRILVESEDISPYIKNAVVAIEDERFYEHRGVDFAGIGRALAADILPGGSTQGASTITMQFVKNALAAQGSRTVLQKFREAALAYQLEKQWDKDKILTQYLNTIYFGEGAYGIEAAARTYFGKRHPECLVEGADPCASEVTPDEAAMLAGIITSPSAYSPRANPQAATDRRNLVLAKMKDQGVLSDEEYDTAIATSVPVASDIERPKSDSLAPYFTSWLRQQVVDLYGAGRAFGGGLDIRTTLDLDMQQAAESAAYDTLAGVEPTASAVVIDNNTGAVKAMVGGNNFDEAPFNLATNGHRQPGSSFKPFTLATALSQGISPNTSYSSNEKIFKVPNSKNEIFDVHNYDDTYYGSSSLESGTIHSDNSVYAELALGQSLRCITGCGGSPAVRGGTQRIANTAHDMGLDTPFSTNPSMVLGAIDPGVTPLEMAHAYSTISHDGERMGGNLDTSPGANNDARDLGPVAISKIVGPDGDTIAENKTKTVRVLSSSVATEMRNILHLNVLEGTGKRAQFGDSAEWGKTGTTENNGDAWFCGGSTDYTACVWVGHAQTNTPMETEYGGLPVDGGTFPAEIWAKIMAACESIRAQHEAEDASGNASDGEGSTSSSYSAPSTSSSSSSSSPSSSSGGGGGAGQTAPSGGGGGGGGGGATGGTTGGTGL